MNAAIIGLCALASLVNVVSLNYVAGFALSLSGQSVSAAIIGLATFAIVYSAALGHNFIPVALRQHVLLTLILVIAIPLIGYLLNYDSQGFDGLLFWLKRVLLNLSTVLAGLILFQRLNDKGWLLLSAAIFGLTTASVFFSQFFPDLAAIYFTADEDIWGDLSLRSFSRASGLSLNPNEAAFATVVTYLVLYVVMSKRNKSPSIFLLAAIDLLFFGSLLLTGSRAGFLNGSIVYLTLTVGLLFESGLRHAFSRARFRRVAMRIALWISVGGILMFGADRLEILSVERLVEPDRSESVDSNELRIVALYDGLHLLAEHPILGVGFEKSAEQLILLPHNMFVYYAVNNGFFLALFYPLFLVVSWRQMSGPSLFAVRACLFWTLFGFSFFDHSLLDYKQFPWLLIGMYHVILFNSNRTPDKLRDVTASFATRVLRT